MASRGILSERSESKDVAADARTVAAVCYVYLVECAGGWLYTGVSADPRRRFQEHQAGGSRFTKAHPAARLLWTEAHPTRAAAEKRERQLKGWTRARKLALAAGDLAGLRRL